MAKSKGTSPTHKPLADAVEKFQTWYGAKSKRPLIQSYTQNLAEMQVADILGEKRLEGLANLTQNQANKATAFVQKEEAEFQKLLAKAYVDGDRGLKIILQEYLVELSTIYYDSQSVEINPFDNDNPIQEKYLPTLDLIINALNTDPAFDAEPLKPAQKVLLGYANKIKSALKSRISLEGKLKGSLSKLMGSDVVMGALAGAATQSPIFALGLFAWQQSKKKNDYADKFKLQRKKFELASRLEKRKARPETTAADIKEETPKTSKTPAAPAAAATAATPVTEAATTAEEVTLGGNPTASRAERRREHEQVWSASDGMKKLVTIGEASATSSAEIAPSISASSSEIKGNSGQEIVKILNRHTVLLEKIYGVDAKELKVKEDEIEKNLADKEEQGLETQGPSATQLNLPFGEEKDGKSGWFGNLLQIASNFLPIGRIGRVLMTGTGGLLRRLAGFGAAKTAGTVAGAAGAAAATTTATKVAGEAGGATATKAAGPLAEIAGKVSTRIGETAAGKAVGAAATVIKSAIAKRVPNVIKKMVGETVPGLGLLLGTGFAVNRLLHDPTDVIGAAAEIGSGAGSLATALAIQVPLLARDVYTDAYGTFPENDVVRYGSAYVTERLNEIKNEVAAAIDEKLVELGLKDNKENEQRTKEANQQETAAQQQANQLTNKAETPVEPSAPASTPPPTSAPKPSLLRRLGQVARVGIAIGTAGMSELALYAYNRTTASKQTANASQSNLKLKQGDVTGGGPTKPGVLEFAAKVQSSVPGFQMFTAFNDNFHQGLSAPSKHKTGLAMDFTISGGKAAAPEAVAMVEKLANDAGIKNVYIRDEYNHPSAGATAGHIHVGFNDENSIAQLASAGLQPSPTYVPLASQFNTPSRSQVPTSPTAEQTGDGSTLGRTTIANNLSNPRSMMAGAGGNTNVNFIQGGNNIMGGGGGGSAAQIIPSVTDQVPSVRRAIDAALA